MYKEAQAAPPPSPIGGITAVCGNRTHDFPSARPSPLPTPFRGVEGILVFYEDFFGS
jgi:hypothetical protein